MKSFTSALLCVMIACAPLATFAQEDLSAEQQQRLIRLIDEGKDAYDSGNFEASLEKFRQAYDLYRHPDIIYRIALCYERLGEDVEAVKYYRQFLSEAPNAPERQRIEKTIQVIEERIAKSEIRVTTDPGNAAVYINDTANGVAGYTPTSLPVQPGNYTLIVQKDGYEPVRELVSVDAGQSLQVRYQLSATGTAPVEVQEKNEPDKGGSTALTAPVLGLTAVGVASGITSVIFWGLYKDKADLVTELQEDSGNATRTRFEKEKQRRDINLAVAISTAAVSVGSLVWAYGLWTTNRARQRRGVAGLNVGWNHGPAVSYGVTF